MPCRISNFASNAITQQIASEFCDILRSVAATIAHRKMFVCHAMFASANQHSFWSLVKLVDEIKTAMREKMQLRKFR